MKLVTARNTTASSSNMYTVQQQTFDINNSTVDKGCLTQMIKLITEKHWNTQLFATVAITNSKPILKDRKGDIMVYRKLASRQIKQLLGDPLFGDDRSFVQQYNCLAVSTE